MTKETIAEIMANEPKYRQDQLSKAFFNPAIKSFEEISTFPLELRQKLKGLPWLAVKLKALQKSKIDNTEKALLELSDGLCIETVLMSRGDEEKTRRTICISTQAGCGMGCTFCATGAQGLRRNLTAEEIIDQFRFWQNRLAKENESIGNIVAMGQGEPLQNYENVKKALNTILKNTDIGPSKITISTVGEKTAMGKLLRDKDFPAVRIAISLHSAIEATRKKIIPSTQVGFINFLIKWSEEYHKILGSRSHFLSLEYTLLKNINDDDEHLKALINLARKLGRVKINLIPLNPTDVIASPSACPAKLLVIQERSGEGVAIPPLKTRLPRRGLLAMTDLTTIKKWHDSIMKAGFTCTIRHSQGADIAAACGQLNTEYRD